ncbi:MAG TPA: vWA domain-containing protein [Verrucomicrobiae bacterium]|nr:vWA domain-containing protein [Verrucomicrobiae bacterium]
MVGRAGARLDSFSLCGAAIEATLTSLDATAGPRPRRLLTALGISTAAHAFLALLLFFDVLGIGGGFGLGLGPGFGIGSGGGLGLGRERRREIFSLEDLPAPVPPNDPNAEQALKELLKPASAQAILVPAPAAPRPTSPTVHFAPPARPLGAGVDLGSRFASAGAGVGGFGLGGGGGGAGWSLGTSFERYVGSLRKVGLDVAVVIDATGSMQNVIDDLKRRMDDLAATMQRLVPTARVGAVTYRDRDDDEGAKGGPRQSEAFLVKWTDLTFNVKKVQTFLDGIVAEGGGDWEEAVKDGLECAMRQLKWRSDAKKVIILVGSSPPHPQDVAAIHKLIADWRARGGVVSTIDVSLMLHEEFERQMARWLHNEDLKEVSPLPDFYKEVSASFGEMAKEGGGQMIAMGQQSALVRHLLVLTFGPSWERDVARIARGF